MKTGIDTMEAYMAEQDIKFTNDPSVGIIINNSDLTPDKKALILANIVPGLKVSDQLIIS